MKVSLMHRAVPAMVTMAGKETPSTFFFSQVSEFCVPEHGCVHRCVSADGPVRERLDQDELVVQHLADDLVVQLANQGEQVVVPIKVLFQQKSHFVCCRTSNLSVESPEGFILHKTCGLF